jgi:hypothetical protein
MGVKGNSGGKKGRSGRKSKAEELGLAALLNKCWSRADREACIRALATKAQDPTSDHFMDAAKLLMAYCFGKPAEKHEISNPDGSSLMEPIANAMLKVYGSGK